MFLFILIVRSVALEIYNNWGSAKVVVALDPEKATSALKRSADLLHSMLSGIKLFWIMEKVFSEPYVTTQMSDSTDKPSSCAQKLRSSNNAFKHLSRRKLSFGEKAAQKQQINGTATLSQKQQYSENNNIRQNYINNRNLVACPAVPVYGDEHERMRYEWTRFESFYRVPETDLPPGTRPIHLAQGGFYFGRISRLVRCFSCGERHPTHLHGCTRMVENVPFCKPPSPPPTHSPDNPSLMNVVTRPQCSCCAQKACIGSDPCLLGFASSGSQTDGLSSTSQAYPASLDNRPRNDPIRRYVTSGEADEALARMACKIVFCVFVRRCFCVELSLLLYFSCLFV